LRWIHHLAVFAGCSLLITAYLFVYDQRLLTSRVQAGPAAETERSGESPGDRRGRAGLWHRLPGVPGQQLHQRDAELGRLPTGSIVIHGDAPGADTLAGQVARDLGLTVIRMAKNDADAQRHGRRTAWKGLNERMLQQGVELVLAFHSELAEPSRAHGTRHAIRLAEQQGILVRVIGGGAPAVG
jgi:hypothetical protein